MATTASEPATGVTDDLTLAQVDPEVYAAVQGEATRLRETIQLIPSENYPSAAVLEATSADWISEATKRGRPLQGRSS